MEGLNVDRRVKGQRSLPGNLDLRAAYMMLLEEELTIQVAHINGIQINLMEYRVLEGSLASGT